MMKFKKVLVTIVTFLMCVSLISIAAHAQGNEPDTTNTQEDFITEASEGVEINDNNFPDEVFRQYVLDNFDTNISDGILDKEEIEAANSISVLSMNIDSLEGLKYFTELEYLHCGDNNLQELDVSQNTKLNTLYCFFNNINELDVSNNPELVELSCGSCNMEKLDLGHNSNMFSLICYSNDIHNLDISGCSLLINAFFNGEVEYNNFDRRYSFSNERLYVDNNTCVIVYDNVDVPGELKVAIDSKNFPDDSFREFVNRFDYYQDGYLSDLEISRVKGMSFYGNPPENDIDSFEGIEFFSELENLVIENYIDLDSIDISNNSRLKSIWIRNTSLSAVDVDYNTELLRLDCSCNGKLNSLDLGNNTELVYLSCFETAITTLDISSCKHLLTVVDKYDSASGEYRNNDILIRTNKDTILLYPGVGSDEIIVKIDEKSFPDSIFREYVMKFDTNSDGYFSDYELNSVQSIKISYSGYYQYSVGLKSLKGIEYFTLLKRLELENDPQLEEMDISNNVKLEYLSCAHANRLPGIDVSNNKALKTINCTGCSNTAFESIDVSNNQKLETLYCNSCYHLKNIIFGDNTRLHRLSCQSTDISSLDITSCKELVNIFEDVKCIIVSDYLTYSSNIHPNNILEIDLKTKLIYLDFDELGTAIVSINETTFPDEVLRNYVFRYDQNDDGKLSEREIKDVYILDLNGNILSSLKGVEYFNSLKELRVAECQLSELDVSCNKKLDILDCGGNNLKKLDLSNNTELTTLVCRDNNFKNLDLSNNALLKKLFCFGNPLEKLDISNTQIIFLDCSNCNLEELICKDDMVALNCSHNNLSIIRNLNFCNEIYGDTSYSYYLEGATLKEYFNGCTLKCSNNELSELILSQITNLYELDCSNNRLTQIDVSNISNLYTLNCSNNNLTAIDISHQRLGWIYCSNNKLKELDASQISYGFDCSNNQIESLVFGEGGYYFTCYNNNISSLDVSKNWAIQQYVYSWTKDGVTVYTSYNHINSDWTVDSFKGMSHLLVDESTIVFPIEKIYGIRLIPGNDELRGGGFTIYDSIEADGNYSLPDCEFTAPEGYEFDVWEVKIGSNEAVYYNSGDVISASDHMTVTATWKKAPCYVFEDGVLTLRGDIVANEIKEFNQKNEVKSIKAEDGTVFPEDCSSLFDGYIACETIDFSNVDTSNVTDMSNMFYGLNLKQIDLSGFDMSSVINAYCMLFCYHTSVPDEITLGDKFTKIDSSMGLMNGHLGWACGSPDSEKVSGDEWSPAVISNTGKNTYYKKRAKWDDLDYEFSIIETVIPDTSIGNIGFLQVVHTPEDLYNEEHLACEWRRDGELINNEQNTMYRLKKEDIGHTFTCMVFDSTLETSGYKTAEFKGSGKAEKAPLNLTSEELEAKWKSEPCSEEGATDGKIYNLSENVEYATKPDFSDSKLCSDAKPEDWITTDDGVALTGFAAGTYYIRYFETDTCQASETAVVVVEEPKKEVTWGDTEIIIFKYVLYEPYQEIEVPRFGDTLYAYIATSDGSYSIPGLSAQYQWMRGDEIIEGATDDKYKVQREDIGYIISCVITDASGTITGSICGDTKAKADKAYCSTTAEELAKWWTSEPCSKKGASDGIINTMSENVEIATKPDFSDSFRPNYKEGNWTYTDSGASWSNFKAGTYYLRIAETDCYYAGETVVVVVEDGPAEELTGTVSISGTAKFGQKLIATVSGSNASAFTYQWKRGNNNISDATSFTYTLVKEDIGQKITCVVSDKSGEKEGIISETTASDIEKADGPAAPANVKGIASTVKGASDGQITGVSSLMEYASKADFGDKKKCAETITGLAAGIYYVRIAETDTAKAGASIEIEVGEGPEAQKTQEELVGDFVKRFYTIILEREQVKDEEVEYYTSRLMSHEIDGCSVARGFVMSPEYTGKGDSDLDFVIKMYAAFFNREADAAQYYCDILALGYSREVVLAGFVNSPEFKALCAEYGIEPGELIIDSENNNQENNQGNNEENNQGSNEGENQGNNEENNQGDNNENNPNNQGDITKLNLDSTNVDPEKLDNYVQNLYLQILGRGFDEGGLEYWKENIMAGEVYDAATAARVGFFESPEYLEKNKTNEEFVIDCYHAFLGRDPEPSGLEYWTEKLDSGEYSKQKVIDLGFGHSEEFKNILRDCGFRIIE